MDYEKIIEIAQLITAIASIFIAVLSLRFTRKSQEKQEKHNKLSVKPIPHVEPYNFVDYIAVEIQNNGIGPLIIQKIVFTKGKESHSSLIDFFNSENIVWSTYSNNLNSRSILPGSSVMVLEIKGDDNNVQFEHYKHKIRSTLKDMTIRIAYENIYGDRNEFDDDSLVFFDNDGMITKKKKYNPKQIRRPNIGPVDWKI